MSQGKTHSVRDIMVSTATGFQPFSEVYALALNPSNLATHVGSDGLTEIMRLEKQDIGLPNN